jgi:chromosome partitioning protein
VKRRANRKLAVAGFVPTLFDARRSQDDRTLRAIQERFMNVAPIYDPIPWSTGFADAAEARLPLALYDKRHKAIASIDAIATQLDKLL